MSPASTSAAASSPDFRLKAGLFPFTVLEIVRYERASFEAALRAKVAEAPAFFAQTPVILNLESYSGETAELPLAELRALCQQYQMIPVALRGADPLLAEQASEIGLALMSNTREKNGRQEPRAAVSEPPATLDLDPDAGANIDMFDEPASAANEPAGPEAGQRSRVVSAPVRSGQQIYAAGGDLIILAAVSPGAEVLADGNIHVYGALRGRALAGVRGDTGARIFCHSLEAELISIAGNFQLDEDFRESHWQQAVQASLDDQKLNIVPLVS